MRILDYLAGYCRVSFPFERAPLVHNLLRRLHMDYWGQGETEKEGFLFIRARQKEYLMSFAKKEGIPLCVGRIEGLPRFFFRYAGRYGVFVGLFLGASIMILSSLFVWDVRVEGNERLSKAEITDSLKEYGVGVGSFLPAIDLHDATTSFLIDSQEVGWLSLYRKGNVIYAKVLEKEAVDITDTTPPSPGNGANLVATEDALIMSYALVRGKPCKRVGQVVRKGELLASGVLAGQTDTRFVVAEGEVYGRVTHTLTVEIPLQGAENTFTHTEKTGTAINIFGKTIKIYEDTGNLPTGYATIECKEQVRLFGKVALPVFLIRRYATFTEKTEVALTESQAVRLAHRRMRGELSRILAGGTLLARTSEGRFTENGYVLSCTVTFSRNIAEQVKFFVDNGQNAP